MRNKKYLTTLAVVTAMSLIGCGTKTDTNTVSTDSSVIATSPDAVSETTVESTDPSTTNEESSSAETSSDKSTDESTEPSSETGTEDSTEESTVENSTEEGSTEEPDEETPAEPEGKTTPETEPSTETPTQPEITEEPTVPTTTVIPTTVVPTTTVEPTVPTTTVAPTTVAPTTVAPTTAPSTPEPTKPVVTVKKVEASVKGTHYVGDTLTSTDFTVKVTMSDGSVKTNPSGFTVSPLKLSAKTNTLTVSYGGVSSTFTVNATEKATQPAQTQTVSGLTIGDNYEYDKTVYTNRTPYPAVKTASDANKNSYDGTEIAYRAIWELGKPYVNGGKSHTTGFDCSGLVWYVYHQSGIDIPASASGQAKCGKMIPINEVLEGDIIVFQYNDGTYHTGIYTGTMYVDAVQWSGDAKYSGVRLRMIWDDELPRINLKRIYGVRVGHNIYDTGNPEIDQINSSDAFSGRMGTYNYYASDGDPMFSNNAGFGYGVADRWWDEAVHWNIEQSGWWATGGNTFEQGLMDYDHSLYHWGTNGELVGMLKLDESTFHYTSASQLNDTYKWVYYSRPTHWNE